MSQSVRRLGFLTAVFLVQLLVAGPASARLTVSDLANGQPEIAQTTLNSDSYVKVRAKKLKHAKVCWANLAYFRDIGIDVPPAGMTPQFEKKISDAFGYAVPSRWETPEDYANEWKTFYADKYGGSGIGTNLGSGRAASRRRIQIKGIGQTPLIVDDGSGDKYHVSGGASLAEGIREAIWSEVLNNELPFGSNRVIAVICTGTETAMDMQNRVPRALIVREDPLRPAHFMTNWHALETHGKVRTEKNRVRELVEGLDRALPMPKNLDPNASKGERIVAGVKEFIRRLAKVWAFSYARGLYHGATSPSNVGLKGEALDLGSQTAVEGFPRAQNLVGDDPFGETRFLLMDVLKQFVGDLRETVPAGVRATLPSDSEVTHTFSQYYNAYINREMVALTGVPYPIIDLLKNHQSFTDLATRLRRMAKVGNNEIIKAQFTMPVNTGKYDLNQILTVLARQPVDRNKLRALIPSEQVRNSLLSAYTEFMNEALAKSREIGLSDDAFGLFVEVASGERNSRMHDLVRGDNYWKSIYSAHDKYIKRQDPTILQNYIDSMINKNRRTYRDEDPFTVVISERVDSAKGIHRRTVFDARTSRTFNETVRDGERRPKSCEWALIPYD